MVMKAAVGLVHRLKLRSAWMMGETWTWRMVNMGGELVDSGLEDGEVVQLQG